MEKEEYEYNRVKTEKAKAIGDNYVYTIINHGDYVIEGHHFIPCWNTTDHFHFVCESCKSIADVLEVKLETDHSNEVKFSLFFHLGCPNCKRTGQRKIYLDRRENAGQKKWAFNIKNMELLAFGDKRTAMKIIQLEEKRNG